MKKRIAVFLSLLLLCTTCLAFAEEDAETMIDRGWQAIDSGDYTTAKDLFSKAADLGSAKGLYAIGCLYHLGYGVEQSDEKALEYYTRAGEAGFLRSWYNIGLMYDNGVNGSEPDYAKAFEYFTTRADQTVTCSS